VAATAYTNGAASAAPIYTFSSPTTTPATIMLRGADVDASSAGGTEGTLQIRSGRLRLFNAYGSDVLPLRVSAQVEYFVAPGRWTVNGDDSCIQLQAGMIGLGNRNPAGMSTTVGTVTTAGNGKWTIALTPSTGSVDLAVNLGAGISAANACLTTWSNGPSATTAPTPSLTHLAGQWCGTSADKAPLARARFGSSKAPYIYLRERY